MVVFGNAGNSLSYYVAARDTAGGGSFGSNTAAIYSTTNLIYQLNQGSSTYGVFAVNLETTT